MTTMHKISWNNFLASMQEVGHRDYIETDLDNYAQVMRTVNTPKSRRPKEMAGKEFTTQLFTAVGSNAGDIRYLVCIERTA
jgi:hypothetical protein